jgi:hypothetical protein
LAPEGDPIRLEDAVEATAAAGGGRYRFADTVDGGDIVLTGHFSPDPPAATTEFGLENQVVSIRIDGERYTLPPGEGWRHQPPLAGERADVVLASSPDPSSVAAALLALGSRPERLDPADSPDGPLQRFRATLPASQVGLLLEYGEAEVTAEVQVDADLLIRQISLEVAADGTLLGGSLVYDYDDYGDTPPITAPPGATEIPTATG